MKPTRAQMGYPLGLARKLGLPSPPKGWAKSREKMLGLHHRRAAQARPPRSPATTAGRIGARRAVVRGTTAHRRRMAAMGTAGMSNDIIIAGIRRRSPARVARAMVRARRFEGLADDGTRDGQAFIAMVR
jgi:hypothetical protein